jgi:acetyl esterase/lipase
MVRALSVFVSLAICTTLSAEEQEFQLLWPDGAPGANGTADADQPGFWVYRPEGPSNGTAVVICPGGGYAMHAIDHEGVQPAKFCNRIGVTAFVLRYRLSPYRHPIPLGDAQRAIRLVRANAAEYGINPQRVGIMGFSAGGHLTSTAVTHFDGGDQNAADPVDRQSCRPDFGILGYPVISFVAEYAHKGSARNLLGEEATAEQLTSLSNDTNVTSETPPVFLFHTAEDAGVPPENSLAFYAACLKHKVPAELHIYQQGPHGVGLANEHPALAQWIEQAGTWLRQSGLLTTNQRVAVAGNVTIGGQPLRWGTIAFVPDDPSSPTGWSMINNGKYSIAATAGVVPGIHEVVVTNMHRLGPGPTHEDAHRLDRGIRIVADITAGTGDLDFNFEVNE